MRVEWASIDPQTSDWEPAKHGPTFAFDRDGRQEGRVRAEGATISTFDTQGLRMTASPYGPRIPRQAGLEYGIGMDGNVRFDVLAHYDRDDRPVELGITTPYSPDGAVGGDGGILRYLRPALTAQ
jgi:hypothetical protein